MLGYIGVKTNMMWHDKHDIDDLDGTKCKSIITYKLLTCILLSKNIYHKILLIKNFSFNKQNNHENENELCISYYGFHINCNLYFHVNNI
jgi:hypothetical protein